MEREEREKEKKRLLEQEQLKLELERKDKANQRLFDLERMKLSSVPSPTTQNDKFISRREVRLVLPFEEVKVDKYFQHFEKVAESLE